MNILGIIGLILIGVGLSILLFCLGVFIFLKGIELGQDDQKGNIALLYQSQNLSFGERLICSALAHFKKIRVE